MSAEALIKAVFKRRVLWDRTNKNHHNGHILNRKWEEIAKQLNISVKDAKNRWKNLRDKFRTEIMKFIKPKTVAIAGSEQEIKIKTEEDDEIISTWRHFESLMFLKDQFTIKDELLTPKAETYWSVEYPDADMLNPQQFLFEDEDFSNPPPSTSSSVVSNINFKRHLLDQSNHITGEIIENGISEHLDKKIKLHREEESDLLFFESLLPHIKKLSDQKKLLLMMEIQQIVYKSVYEQSDESLAAPAETS